MCFGSYHFPKGIQMALSTKIKGGGGGKHKYGILVFCYSKVQMFKTP